MEYYIHLSKDLPLKRWKHFCKLAWKMSPANVEWQCQGDILSVFNVRVTRRKNLGSITSQGTRFFSFGSPRLPVLEIMTLFQHFFPNEVDMSVLLNDQEESAALERAAKSVGESLIKWPPFEPFGCSGNLTESVPNKLKFAWSVEGYSTLPLESQLCYAAFIVGDHVKTTRFEPPEGRRYFLNKARALIKPLKELQ